MLIQAAIDLEESLAPVASANGKESGGAMSIGNGNGANAANGNGSQMAPAEADRASGAQGKKAVAKEVKHDEPDKDSPDMLSKQGGVGSNK